MAKNFSGGRDGERDMRDTPKGACHALSRTHTVSERDMSRPVTLCHADAEMSDDEVRDYVVAAIRNRKPCPHEVLLNASDVQLERTAKAYERQGYRSQAKQIRLFISLSRIIMKLKMEIEGEAA